LNRTGTGLGIALGLLVASVLGWAASTPAPASTRPAGGEGIATVGSETITRDAFDRRWAVAQQEYRARTGGDIPPEYLSTARRQVLELLIRQRLLSEEAGRRGIRGTADDIERFVRADPRFTINGRYDPARRSAYQTSQPADYQRLVNDVRATVGARLLYEQIEREIVPTDEEVRAADTRALTSARIQYLPLIRTGFDGSYPEPTEADVLAEYRRRASQTMRPSDVQFSAIFVDQPALPESSSLRADLRVAWERRMQKSADSLIAAARAGASLERLAAPFGGLRSINVARGERWPAWWRGTAADTAELFGLAPGRIGPHAYAMETGRVVMRLDRRLPPHPAPLSAVSPELRERLRRDARANRDQRALEALYPGARGAFKGPASPVLYAVADTSTFPIHQPTLDEMQAYYRDHLTDFSSLAGDQDESAAEVRTQSFAEVRDDIYRRLANESRQTTMQSAIQRVAAAWQTGRRDPDGERALTRVRDAGLVWHLGRVDTSLAGLTTTDTLVARGWDPGVRTFNFRRGIVVVQVGPEVASYTPSFDEARPELERRLAEARTAEAERGARHLYDTEPGRFRQAKVFFMGRLIVPLPFTLDVQVSRAEVEGYYHSHIADFSTMETIRIRQILVSPRDGSATAMAAARARADSLLARARAGEDFAELARRNSDDPASRDGGGDMGLITRGQMVPEFERQAFALEPGQLGGPVVTELGFHVLQCVEHDHPEVTPLAYCYNNVSWTVAGQRVDQVAHQRADSLRRVIHTPAQARALDHKGGLIVIDNVHPVGEPMARDLVGFFRAFEKLESGQMYPGVQLYRGLGYAIAWVDSVVTDRLPPYSDVQPAAVETWNRLASERAVVGKRAELDSLARAGWSLDSLGTLFGGLSEQDLLKAGTPLKDLGGPLVLDSLVYGPTGRPPALAVGQATDWVTFPNGYARIRLVDRVEPDPYQVTARAPRTRETIHETRLRQRFSEIAARYPVRISDMALAATPLPAP
jgi:parvulin-like peptidyl-prolyl isomerase